MVLKRMHGICYSTKAHYMDVDTCLFYIIYLLYFSGTVHITANMPALATRLDLICSPWPEMAT